MKRLDYRVIPVDYNIYLEPDLVKFKFKGVEKIKLKVAEKTRKIRLNSKGLSIEKAWINGVKAGFEFNEKNEEVVFECSKHFSGNVELKIEFNGKNGELHGFYKSSYVNKGREKHLLSTQFEPADARAAFPCFDEPAFKATFNLSVLIEKNLTAISNTEIKKNYRLNGKKLVVFEQTPKMSTYLLYLGVGEFEHIEGRNGKTKISVYVTPGKLGFAKLPLNYAAKALRLYEEYFGLDYQLKKLDLIGIPDFSAGAMENWGAISFRETSLLCDESTPISDRQNIANTIVHELAHQWFGDLVTMKWWDDLWLNESFATFMSFKMVDRMMPEWDTMLRYLNSIVSSAFAADGLESTHPVNCEVKSPGEIDELFDEISYEKGGSILRMIEDFIGKEAFRSALHYFLKKHSYGNASKEDLWGFFEKEAFKRGVKFTSGMVRQWIEKPGYPVVEVEKTKEGFSISQKRFTLLKNMDDYWEIPLHYSTETREGSIVLNKKSLTIKEESDWIKLNLNQAGFYRVFYSSDILKNIGMAFLEKKVSTVDFWGVENDLFVQARTGRVKLKEYLNFVDEFCMDSAGDYPLNSSVSNHLNWFFTMTYNEKPFFDEIKRIFVLFHERMLEIIGWERKSNERNINTILRSKALASLGMAGHEKALKKTDLIFSQAFNNRKTDSDLKSVSYALKAWTGRLDLFNKMVKKYEIEEIPEENARLLNSMGMFGKKEILSKALSYSQSRKVKLQDSFRIPLFASGNPIGKDLIWSWTKKNWRELEKKNKIGINSLHHYVDELSVLSGEKTVKEVEQFFKKNSRDDIKRAIMQTIERIKANTKFKSVNLD